LRVFRNVGVKRIDLEVEMPRVFGGAFRIREYQLRNS
jgi:hypothetical protein